MSKRESGMRFETRDAEAATIARFGAWIALVIVAVAVGLVPFIRHLAALEARHDPPPPPMARPDPNRLPPEPRLQTDPFGDFTRLKEEESERLESYGWVDRQAGIAHVPIEEAMKMVVEKGLPSR